MQSWKVVATLATLWILTTGLCSGYAFFSFVFDLGKDDSNGIAARMLVPMVVGSALVLVGGGWLLRRYALKQAALSEAWERRQAPAPSPAAADPE